MSAKGCRLGCAATASPLPEARSRAPIRMRSARGMLIAVRSGDGRVKPGDDGSGSTGATRSRPGRVRPRDAAALILWRDGPNGAEVLMGRRHPALRFMPGVWVFPGGRVDPLDHRRPALSELPAETRARLERRATPARARAIAVAAARELHEETGLTLGELQAGVLRPALGALAYLCHAVTPPGGPVRFDARFLLAPAAAASGTIAGSGELDPVAWLDAAALAALPVASITRLVLGEFRAWHGLPAAGRAGRPVTAFRMDRAVAGRTV